MEHPSVSLAIEEDDDDSSSTDDEEDAPAEVSFVAALASDVHHRAAVPSSRSTFFAHLVGGAHSSVPASGILGIPEGNSSRASQGAKHAEPTVTAPASMAGRGSMAENGAALRRSVGAAADSATRTCDRLPDLAASLMSNVLTAIPIAILSYATITTYALMIVEGSDLPRELVVSIQLFSSVVSGIFLALTSECPQTIASSDVSIALFYQVWVVQVYTNPRVQEDEKLPTALVSMALMTVLMSLVFSVVGMYRGADLVQYLPFPVTAGFLALIGAAITKSSLTMTLGRPIDSFETLIEASQQMPYQLAACLSIAFVLLLLRRYHISFQMLLTGTMVVALALFYAVTEPLDIRREQLASSGWLFPKADVSPFYAVWASHDFAKVRWLNTMPPADELVGMFVILILSLVLRISGIASATARSVDIDREMQITGWINVVVGLLGGHIGSHSPGLVSMNKEAGTTSRMPGIAQALILLCLWISGFPLTNLLPRFLLGGVLLNLGIMMLVEWAWAVPRLRMQPSSHALVLGMAVYSLYAGVMQTVFAGLLGTSFVLVYRFSRLPVVKYHVSMRSLTSVRRREREDAIFLRQNGWRVHAIGLEGFLFEGTTVKLVKYLNFIVRDDPRDSHGARPPPPEYLILDMSNVHGINETAGALLSKFTRQVKISVLFAALGPSHRRVLENNGAVMTYNHLSVLFRRTADAMEFCEERLLAARDRPALAPVASDLEHQPWVFTGADMETMSLSSFQGVHAPDDKPEGSSHSTSTRSRETSPSLGPQQSPLLPPTPPPAERLPVRLSLAGDASLHSSRHSSATASHAASHAASPPTGRRQLFADSIEACRPPRVSARWRGAAADETSAAPPKRPLLRTPTRPCAGALSISDMLPPAHVCAAPPAAPAECVAAKPSARLVLPDEAVDAAAAKAAEALVARAVDAALLAAGGAPPPPPPRHHQSTPNLADPPQHSSASFARRANSLSSAAYWLARDASAGEAEVLPLLASDAAHALPERGSPAPGARRFAGLPKPQRVEAVEVDEYEDAAHVHDASSLRASAFSRNGPPTRRRRAPPMGCFASLLPGLDLELFAECGEWMFAVKGDMLTQQGDFCSAIYFVVPTGGSVLLELDVGHVAGPVPVLHSGDLGAVVGVASVLGKEPCGYSCVAVEEGAWAFRVSSSAWRRTADLHPAWMLQLQRVALLQEMYNMSRIRSMSRLWLAGGWTGANFDTVTALSDPSPQESAPPKQEQEEHVHSFLPKALQGAVRGIERASKGWLSQLSENEVEDEDGAASRNEWFMSSQARWAHAASRWVSRRRPVGTDLH
ncbi:hypothetical protein AB1Y20_010492 [Prymnesium parvum]|uniref:STAS domain-containing protein n=1 Tax=Prymnesium parvum TaxID=97485 RepID=A0AB34IPV8_PRYPA